MSRNQPASYPSSKPIVATNNPMAIKDRETPPASATGPRLCSEAAAPRTIGSNGSTHGDRIESTPARNARPKPTIDIHTSSRLVEQGRNRTGVLISNSAACLLGALERNYRALHPGSSSSDPIFLGIEVHPKHNPI